MYKRLIYLIILVFNFTSCVGIKEVENTESEKNEYQDLCLESVISNGDVVNLHGEFSNIDVLNRFIENVKNGNDDKIRIVQYTTEGDPVVATLNFIGDVIYFQEDFTMDTYGSGNVISDVFRAIDIRELNMNDKLTKRVILYDEEHEYDLMGYPND